MPRSAPPTFTLEETRVRFEEWRRNREGRAAIPDLLWAAAMEVAQREGVGRTASTLHLDSNKLKRLMVQAGMITGSSNAPAFVELVAPHGVTSVAGVPECLIELEGRQGKLRIHFKGASATDLATLSRALWDAVS